MDTKDLLELRDVRDLTRTGAARGLRLAACLSLVEVAGALGVATSTLWRWENDERAPHGEAALRYKAFLDDLAARGRSRRRQEPAL